jgi:predicted MPP superfamily phosphohydrolase
MRITTYKLNTPKLPRSLRIALVADLHNRPFDGMLDAVTRISPELICIAGDLIEALDGTMDEKNASGFAALEALCKIAPTFYAPGNHEVGASHKHLRKYPSAQKGARITPENMARIEQSGACFLDNTYAQWQKIAIGGLGTGLLNADGKPDLDALDAFFAHDGYKILLCHHPEYYAKYLRDKDVDLVLAGHAHGGQWRLFGRGLYAPDQGIFPKYTSGVHEGRLVISRGTANTGGIIPRLFNPREVVCIQIN